MINQIHIFRLFLLVCLLGCSNQFKIEKNSSLTVKEFYYQEWVSGLKGGGSGYNIFLLLDKNSMNSDFQIQGLYFREKYCKLKSQGDNKYQGFIKTSKNIIPNISDNPVPVDKSEYEKIPFSIEKNIAVVSFTENGKQKYVKLKLKKKQNQYFPM